MCLPSFQVNGITMYGKTQEFVVNYLRHVQLGSVVDLVVSRPDLDDNDNPRLATPGAGLPAVSYPRLSTKIIGFLLTCASA
jgi:hypothetical protein